MYQPMSVLMAENGQNCSFVYIGSFGDYNLKISMLYFDETLLNGVELSTLEHLLATSCFCEYMKLLH